MERNRKQSNDSGDLEKSVSHLVIEIVEYVPNAVVSRTIIKKITGNITAVSFDEGEELGEKTIAFDTFVQIIDGNAEVTVDNKKFQLQLGCGMIIPAHSPHCFNAYQQFKMISTVIKSGYEDVAV